MKSQPNILGAVKVLLDKVSVQARVAKLQSDNAVLNSAVVQDIQTIVLWSQVLAQDIEDAQAHRVSTLQAAFQVSHTVQVSTVKAVVNVALVTLQAVKLAQVPLILVQTKAVGVQRAGATNVLLDNVCVATSQTNCSVIQAAS